ncbi:chalcone isomerase family protein [Aliidiomarina iranensis]|nr:chalcone isomerase family protein [Aliidiomarina iranensis]
MKSKHVRNLLVSGVASLSMLSLTATASSCGADVVSGVNSASGSALEKVGETRLRVMFFRIYDAELFTETGRFEDAEELLLRLEYARNFTAAKLAEQTQDEWERMGYPDNEESQSWIEELTTMWPDVSSGDCIVAHKNPEGSVTFYGNDGELGTIESNVFADQFLSIWLSEEARYRDSRDELVGVE